MTLISLRIAAALSLRFEEEGGPQVGWNGQTPYPAAAHPSLAAAVPPCASLCSSANM